MLHLCPQKRVHFCVILHEVQEGLVFRHALHELVYLFQAVVYQAAMKHPWYIFVGLLVDRIPVQAAAGPDEH